MLWIHTIWMKNLLYHVFSGIIDKFDDLSIKSRSLIREIYTETVVFDMHGVKRKHTKAWRKAHIVLSKLVWVFVCC